MLLPDDPYAARALDCARLAVKFTDFHEREAMREFALCWLRLSEHAEKLSRPPGYPLRAGFRFGGAVLGSNLPSQSLGPLLAGGWLP